MKPTIKRITKGNNEFLLKTDKDGLKTLYRRDDSTNLMELFIANIKSNDPKEVNKIVKQLINKVIKEPKKVIIPRITFQEAKRTHIPGLKNDF